MKNEEEVGLIINKQGVQSASRCRATTPFVISLYPTGLWHDGGHDDNDDDGDDVR